MLLLFSLSYKRPVLNFLLLFNTVLLSCIINWLHSHSPALAATILNGNETDRLALVAIKARITHDPLGLTNSWNDSLHFCNWNGVICGPRHQRVITLNLSDHNLVGSLSPYVGNLTFLRGINLQLNYFHGEIPAEVGLLSRLRYLNLPNNSFSGEISANISGCSNLIWLRLGFNKLIGNIPYQLGSLQKLERVRLHYNNLTGPIPASLGNLSSVRSFSFAVNSLEESIPDSLGQLKTLNFLGFGENKLTGIVPPSIYNLSSLAAFTVPYNQLQGSLPSNLGFSLPNLSILNVGHNLFTGALPASLSNASNLIEFDINGSNFTGKVNIDFGGLPGLWWLVLASNPLGRGEADDLDFLNSLTKCRNLRILDLTYDQFGGVIPDSIGNLSTELVQLRLGGNRLWGSIPAGIKNLVNMTELAMQKNNLTGNVPEVIENQLSGEIPSGLGSCVTLEHLYWRDFSLMTLNLSFNDFEGMVQTSGVFKNATALSIVGNKKLCGGIPELKMSPCSYSNSEKGKMSQRLKVMIGSLSGLLGLVLIVSLLIVNRLRRVKREPAVPLASSSIKKDLLLKVSYGSLLKATEGFCSENLIGAGSFGSVYRGILDQNETVVAVKVLYLHQAEALKSFMVECETLSNVRHRNLVKLLTACSSVDFQGNEFKALVYEYIPNGSLESWLHPSPKADGNGVDDDLRILSLLQRVNIAIDVASALEYLHHHCQKPIVHRDLKPSNILLENNMTAHVCDFGLAKFILDATERSHLSQTSSAGLKGTVGYAAPEYGMGGMASTYGDIYSYGILMLEMFTGKRPTDEMFKDGVDLHNFVQTALPERISEVVDPLFLAGDKREEEETNEEICVLLDIKKDQLQETLTEILRIGVACSLESPRERMKLGDVIKELQLIRGSLLRSTIS
ncbi:hypothetical protein DITRI_Ditri12bG0181000 [Diplodiscus trichospermus]